MMLKTALRWLLKSEPEKYGLADLMRDGATVWDGVRNAQAAIWLREMQLGDRLFIYHSRTELAVVGLAVVSREAFVDPSDESGRFSAVGIEPVRALPRPVPLAAMRADPALAGMRMFRQFRLSVTPVTPEEAAAILALAGDKEG